jgi:hypothetical protein
MLNTDPLSQTSAVDLVVLGTLEAWHTHGRLPCPGDSKSVGAFQGTEHRFTSPLLKEGFPSSSSGGATELFGEAVCR